jgi:hypothetical protein
MNTKRGEYPEINMHISSRKEEKRKTEHAYDK